MEGRWFGERFLVLTGFYSSWFLQKRRRKLKVNKGVSASLSLLYQVAASTLIKLAQMGSMVQCWHDGSSAPLPDEAPHRVNNLLTTIMRHGGGEGGQGGRGEGEEEG